MRRLTISKCLIVFVLPLMLAACGAKSIVAPAAEVQRAFYTAAPPTSITLYTVINNRSGEGAHASLLINASQQVLFDPAGSWFNKAAPEVNDLMYGMTPQLVGFYEDYHARKTYHIIAQTIVVSPQVAEIALREAQNYGAVPPAFCSNSVSNILSGLPGFESLNGSMFPKKLSKAFGEYPGVVQQSCARGE